MRKLRIILADDHGVLRAGLRALVDAQPDLEIVGEAGDAEAAVQLVAELQPDVVVIDVRMPGGGLAAARTIHFRAPRTHVLILSQYDDPAYLRQAMVEGASGYALKSSSGHELLGALRSVGRGEVYLHPSLARVLVEDTWGPRPVNPSPSAEPLSERETQVLRLVALGYTTQNIAEQLFLSVRTVETYKTRAMEKLNLRGRAALVRYALENGLLEPQPQA